MDTYGRVEVVSENYEDLVIERTVHVEFTFDEDYSEVEGRKQHFVAALLNDLDLPETVIVEDTELFRG